MVALQLCVTVGLGMGVKGKKELQKREKVQELLGWGVEGRGGWKHREETALHPDSVTENKDNLFPSHSITVHCTAHGNTVLQVQHSDTSETNSFYESSLKHISVQNKARTRIWVVMLCNQELCQDKAYQSGNMGVGDIACVCVCVCSSDVPLS